MTVEGSRTRKSARNAVVGIAVQVVLLGLGIAVRSVFVATLGIELVGVDALFLSLLSILALADAGLAAAVMHAMYRPLREGDQARLAALVGFTRSMYRWVAGGIFFAGLMLLPFLSRLANTSEPVPRLHLYYMVLVLGTAGSYLFSYRSTLLVADQRAYVVNLYSLAFRGGRQVLQIVALLAFHDYLMFVLLTALGTLGNAVALNLRSGRIYPVLREPAEALPNAERRILAQGIRAMLIYRISGVVLNNSTPVLVVAISGAAIGGYYANHMLVVGALMLILDTIFTALSASVGHLAAEGSKERSCAVLDEIALLAALLYGAAATGIAVILGDVIELWLGEQFVLGRGEILAISFNFMVYGLMTPVMAFRNATGLFRDARYALALTAAISIVLAVALGRWYGLQGILVAAPLGRLVGNYWIEPWLLLRRHLGGSFLRFMGRQTVFMGAVMVSVFFLTALHLDRVDSVLLRIALGGALSVAVPTILIGGMFWRTGARRSLTARITLLIRP